MCIDWNTNLLKEGGFILVEMVKVRMKYLLRRQVKVINNGPEETVRLTFKNRTPESILNQFNLEQYGITYHHFSQFRGWFRNIGDDKASSPEALVRLARSDPAKSTRLNLLIR